MARHIKSVHKKELREEHERQAEHAAGYFAALAHGGLSAVMKLPCALEYARWAISS